MNKAMITKMETLYDVKREIARLTAIEEKLKPVVRKYILETGDATITTTDGVKTVNLKITTTPEINVKKAVTYFAKSD
jgi:hypothetical protein